DAGLHPGDEVLPREGEPAAAEPVDGRGVVGEGGELVRDRGGRRGRVALVAAGDGVEEDRRVPDVPGEGADLVEGAGEGDDPVAADPAVRRLQSDDPAERGWLADRA